MSAEPSLVSHSYLFAVNLFMHRILFGGPWKFMRTAQSNSNSSSEAAANISA
jgi:hypothetical protein